MVKQKRRAIALVLMLVMAAALAGCGGGSNAKRPAGLAPDAVVQNFIDSAKADNLKEAGLYVSPDSTGNAKTVIKYVTGGDLKELKQSNVLALKKQAEKGDYAVVLATLQTMNSYKVNVKPVGLTRVNQEWYIVEFDQIYQDAKYKVLMEMMSKL